MPTSNRPLLVKGASIDAARRFLIQHRSHPGWQDFLDELTDAQRRMVDGRIRARGWYVVSDYINVVDAAGRHLSPDDPAALQTNLGRFVMDDGVTSLYRAFFALASPGFTIRLSGLFWFQFYKGSKLKIAGTGKKWAHGVVVDAAYCSVSLCHTIKGAMVSALEHAGAKNVRVEHHHCKSEGGDRCEYKFAWT